MTRAPRRFSRGAPGVAALALVAAIAGVAPAATVVAAPITIPDGWQDLVDDTELLTVSVPADWDDVSTATQPVGGGEAGPAIWAATDLDTFRTTFDAPGLSYARVPFTEDYDEAFDRYGSQGGCAAHTDEDYDDGAFDGRLRHWTSCGASWQSAEVFDLVVSPGNDAFTLALSVQITRPGQTAIVDAILASFNLTHLPDAPVGSTPPTGDSTEPAAESREIIDNLGGLALDVPADWDQLDASPASDGYGNPLPYIAASPDLDGFRPPAEQVENFAAPGVVFRVYRRSNDLRSFVDTFNQPRCTDQGVEPFSNDQFAGYRRSFSDCGGTGSSAHYIIVDPVDTEAFTAGLYVRVAADDDATLDVILDSFSYDPTVMATVMGRVLGPSDTTAGT